MPASFFGAAPLDAEQASVAAARASTLADAVNLARDLVNISPADLYPETFAVSAEQVARDSGLDIEVLDEKALAEGATDQETLRRHARKALGKLVGERTRRRPMIVPVVVTV